MTATDVGGAEADYWQLERLLAELQRQTARADANERRCQEKRAVLAMHAAATQLLLGSNDTEGAFRVLLDTMSSERERACGGLLLADPDGAMEMALAIGIDDPERDRLTRILADSGRRFSETAARAIAGALTRVADAGREDVGVVVRPLSCKGLLVGVLILRGDGRRLRDQRWLSGAEVAGALIALSVRMGKTLQQSAAVEQRYRTVMQSAQDGIFVIELDGRIQDANPRGAEIMGGPVVGRTIYDFVPPENIPHHRDQWSRLTSEEAIHVNDVEISRLDGKRVICDFSVRRAIIDGKPMAIGVARDMTEKRHLEQQVAQAQRMESVGTLTGGVAHDFNNLLAVIMTNTSFLLGDLAQADPRREDVRMIAEAGERGAALTRQLLAFSRRQVLEPRVLDISAVVAGTEKMLRRLVSEDIRLHTRLSPQLPSVTADPGQLEQVIMNLVVNARDAMPAGGTITLETASVFLDGVHAHGDVAVVPGPYVMLAVTDTGSGMDAETRRRAFEPFFTTKELGRGTGLGLSTCYGIIKQSGGYIWLYSEPGHGTVFRIYLPAVEAAPEVHGPRARSSEQRGSETVVLVEDDAALRVSLERALATRGYRVLPCRDGTEALATLATEERVDLVLSDTIMPGISGVELARRLRDHQPAIKLILMSGYADHVILQDARTTGAAFLQKPFTPETLAVRVREVLDG